MISDLVILIDDESVGANPETRSNSDSQRVTGEGLVDGDCFSGSTIHPSTLFVASHPDSGINDIQLPPSADRPRLASPCPRFDAHRASIPQQATSDTARARTNHATFDATNESEDRNFHVPAAEKFEDGNACSTKR